MTIEQFVQSTDLNKKVSAINPNYELYEKVTTQASRHTSRSDLSEFYNIVRPNEEQVFIDWRQSNKRHFTVAPILSFKRMITRVLKSSVRLPEIDKQLFDNIDEFLFDEIIMLSLYDTNAVGIEWPYNPETPDIPLAIPGSYPQNMPLATDTVIFKFDKVVENNQDFVLLYNGQVNLGTEKKPKLANTFIGADKERYFLVVPYLGPKEDVLYRVDLWYLHKLKRIPIFTPMGVKMSEGYKETIAWGAYEYLDEAIISISSDQINRIRNVLPKLVVNADLDCNDCNSTGFHGEGAKKTVCNTCRGSGKISEIGDFSTIKIRGRNEFDRTNSNPIYYVQQTGDLKYSKQVWEDLILQAEKQLCTDLLEGTGNESGVAKELRLEPRQDLLVMYGEQFCQFIEAYINNRTKLRKPDSPEVTIVPPSYYETKTPDMLKLYATQSLPAERQRDYLMYVKTKYRGNDFMIDVHTKAMLYAPLLLYKQEEASEVVGMGAYTEKDIKRRDYAIFILGEIMEENPDIVENKKIFELADKMLIDLGILEAPTMSGEFDEITSVDQLPDDLDELEEVLSKLLNNEIDRETALKLVMVIEDVTIEEAEELLTDTGL